MKESLNKYFAGELTSDEKVKEIDIELEMMEMSEVFGGSNIKNNYSIVELLKNVNAMAL